MFGDFLQAIDLLEKLKDKRVQEYIEADREGRRELQLKVGHQVGALSDAIRVLRVAWEAQEKEFSRGNGQ